jgi:deazaflavin-dependent oxidoreductase (nitroreductase family)
MNARSGVRVAAEEARRTVARTYRVGIGSRLVNRVFTVLTRRGLGAPYRHLLTVQGRKSGRVYSTPVDVMEVGGDRWLVAGYGVVNWVHNVRASGAAALSRGGESRAYRVVEATPDEAVPVLREYMRQVQVTAPYFDATPDSPDEAVAAEVARHPVFRLVPEAAGDSQD